MRCFIAVDLPDFLKAGIVKTQTELSGFDSKLVEEENLHFTLKFLGDVSEDKIDVMKNRLATIHIPKFNVRLNGVGFFPNDKFIRVVWIGTESKEFSDLHNDVNNLLSDIVKKEKPMPHLTLARIKTQSFREELIEFSKRHEKEDFGSFEVSKILLKKSTVTRNGPVYEDIQRWALQ
jgi:RNA 2',3'-cyclic 3'-phosphodiesterase